MVGYQVRTDPNGVIIHQGNNAMRLNQDECNKLASLIWLAQRKYWKKEKAKAC
jgi:hypothetical protein